MSRGVEGPPRRGGNTAFVLFSLIVGAGALADPPKFTVDRPLDVKHARIEVGVDLEKKKIDAVATLEVATKQATTSLVLDAVDFDVRSVKVASGTLQKPGSGELPSDFKPVRFANTGRTIELYFDPPLPAGHQLTVQVDYSVTDPKDGLHFFAPTPDAPDVPHLVWSQGQAEENRYWIPSFDDPNERQTTEVVATVDSKYTVVSNGTLQSRKDAGNGRATWSWLQDKVHPIYLVTLIVGEFATLETKWRGKLIQYHAHPSRKDELERSFANTPRMLDFFSDKIGVEYPWDKYTQTCCHGFGGGMENTSATTLGEGALHDAKSAVDGVSDGLIAHELAHQWWGDLLTCKEWAHLWLNEGFASYFEALWDEHAEGPDEFAYNMYGKAGGAISGGKTLPIVHRGYKNPGEQFDSRAYPKGAWVLHMLRRRVGDDTFWKVLNHYCKTHAYQSVETSDLRHAFEDVTGRSFERFFYDWTERPGHPVLDVAFKWDEQTKMAEVTIKQTQEAEAYYFPLALEFHTQPGSAPLIVTREIADKLTTVAVALPARPIGFVVDPANSVLKEITENKPRDLWVAQLTHEDAVARIRAAQALAKDKSDANRAALAEAFRSEKFSGVRDEIAGILGDFGGDVARDALLDGLKAEQPRVRRAAAEALGKFVNDGTVASALQAIVTGGDASYRVEAAAIRAYSRVMPDKASDALREALKRESSREQIRSAALESIGRTTDPAAYDLLVEWSAKARPRECRTAALGALSDLAQKKADDDPAVAKVVTLLTDALGDSDRRVRDSAARGLGELGKRAASALPKLRETADSLVEVRATRSARNAIERIEKDDPASKQLADLRKQFDELRGENRKLHDEIDALDAKFKALQGSPAQ